MMIMLQALTPRFTPSIYLESIYDISLVSLTPVSITIESRVLGNIDRQ